MTTEPDELGETESARSAKARAEAALGRLPPRPRQWLAWLLSRWPGRIAIRSAEAWLRIDIFDRSMTIAAQLFSSVIPILILFATWADGSDTHRVADWVGMPPESQSVVEEAVQGADSAAFGIVGSLIVLVSATSLSRALTRAFAAVWELPRPKSRLSSAWRWLSVVLVLAISLIVVRALGRAVGDVPPGGTWPLAFSWVIDVAVALFLPWVLLMGMVPPRLLAPGAVVFALLMLVVRPASAAWLPRALETSADRYGSLGVAFTYLAWLYTVSFCFFATAAAGRVIATDTGPLGTWIRRQEPDSAS